jgi:nucleoside-diphosphate-sugar epimerase
MKKVLLVGERSFIAHNIKIFLKKKKIDADKISFAKFLKINLSKINGYQYIINCSTNLYYINNKYNSKFDNDFLIASMIAKLKNRLILISTRKVYRNSSNISENSKIAPTCNYSKNKKISEIKSDKILKKRLIIIRTSNIIGIKNKSQHLHNTFIDNFLDFIKKGKIQYGEKDYKDFVTINQFCEIIYRILINKNHLYGVFNLSINKKIYIRDIVSWLLKYCSKDIKIIEKKKSMFESFTLNNKKLSKKLNYHIKKKELMEYCWKISKFFFYR